MPLALAAAAALALPAQAMTPARTPLPGFHLMRATRTAMRLGWSASRGARSYSYRLDQMNGIQVRSGSGPGFYHTVNFSGLHPGWEYRATVRVNPADGPGQLAVLYVTLPGSAPPREYAYQWAESQAGTRYVYGAEGLGGYDCSGLVRTAYRHAGIWLPRTTGQMLGYRRLDRESSPRQGDLVFFGTGHVELYDSQDRSFGAESGPDNKHAGSWWYRWWPGNWWPTAFYRVHGAG
jgi:cell wall-associated NlpC family hydrolase